MSDCMDDDNKGWWVLLVLGVITLSVVFGVPLYWKWRWHIFDYGYETAATHIAAYVSCSGPGLPSRAWRDKAYHHVPEDFRNCEVVRELKRKVGEHDVMAESDDSGLMITYNHSIPPTPDVLPSKGDIMWLSGQWDFNCIHVSGKDHTFKPNWANAECRKKAAEWRP